MENIYRTLWYFLIIMFIVSRVVAPLIRTMTNPSSGKVKQAGKSAPQIEKDMNMEAKKTSIEIEMVKDAYCDKHVSKDKAYRIVNDDGSTHYFCSWECRQKFIEEKNFCGAGKI